MRDINAGVVEINKSTVFVQPALKKFVVGDPERELTVRQIITAEIDAPPLQIDGRILLVQMEDVVVSAIHIGIAACPYRIQRRVPCGREFDGVIYRTVFFIIYDRVNIIERIICLTVYGSRPARKNISSASEVNGQFDRCTVNDRNRNALPRTRLGIRRIVRIKRNVVALPVKVQFENIAGGVLSQHKGSDRIIVLRRAETGKSDFGSDGRADIIIISVSGNGFRQIITVERELLFVNFN